MKSFLFSLLALLAVGTLSAQSYNTTLRSQVTLDFNANDIWGYVAPDGTEYAIMGTLGGTGVISLANPDSAYTVAFIPGPFSLWRDIKSYGEYAYVVADRGSVGITILDLSGLPDTVTATTNNLPVPGQSQLNRAHNIYIDVPTGLAYIAGSQRNSGGMLIYDLTTNPEDPQFVGLGPRINAHDVYVQDGIMFSSELNAGRLAMYDVSDPQNITFLGSVNTPFNFSHNAWSNATNTYVFTTDEKPNASVAAYDITDPSDPILIDEYRPVGTVGSGVIPHNVHVIDNYLSTSYYTAGLTVVDASVPDNLVEIARFDTYPGSGGGFDGNWGAYPFLPSGLTLASDQTGGLFVIEVDYKRAARLKGLVTDAASGAPLNNVTLTLEEASISPSSTLADGTYATGVADGGNYTLRVEAEDYLPLTLNVTLENGVETVLDIALNNVNPRYVVSGNVISSTDESGIGGAEVLLVGAEESYTAISEPDGSVFLDFVFGGTYEVFVAKWGFQNASFGTLNVGANQSLEFILAPGVRDDFNQDQGWTTQNEAPRGKWVRGVPNGTFSSGVAAAPGNDIEGDLGDQAYVTGNRDSDGVGDDDIDGGEVILTSPLFNGEEITNPQLAFSYWFFNAGGDGSPNDTLKVMVDNGVSRVLMADYTTSGSEWRTDSLAIADFIEPTDQMQLIFIAGDDSANGHIVEAGIDGVSILSGDAVSATENLGLAGLEVLAFPNPSSTNFRLNYRFPNRPKAPQLEVFDNLGRRVESLLLQETVEGNLTLGQGYPAGTYFLRMSTDGQVVYTTKIQKF